MPQKRVYKLQVSLTDAELQAIDDFRFNDHLPSCADAARELMRRGLESLDAKGPEAGRRPGGFGVLGNKH